MPDYHIHFFYGNDEFAIRKETEKYAAMFSDPTTAGMNTARLDVRTASDNDLSNATSAMPFLAERRLVVVENASKRFTGQDGHKRFMTFLDGVPAFTRLVLVEAEEIKEKDFNNHWLVKWVRKNPEKAEARGFMLPHEREIPAWIVKEAKKQGGAIELPAAARLAEMTGENTRQAALEITKLLTYVNFAHPVGLEDVEAVSIVTAGVDIFDLVDAIGNQNAKQAQKLFHRLLEDKDAFEIFGLVVRQFRLLTLAREVIEENGGLPEVIEALRVLPFVAEKSIKQARNFSMDTLKSIYHRLLAMDEAAKSGGMPLETSLDILIVELAGRQ